MNLKFKFLLFVSLIIIFIFTVVTIVLSIGLSRSVQDELVSKDKILAERIVPDLSNNLGDYYTYNFAFYAISIKTLFRIYPDLLHFRIFNPQGQTIVDSAQILKGDKKILFPKADQQTFSIISSQKSFQDFAQYNGEKTIRIFVPFIDNYGIYRLMVEYDFSLQSVNAAIRETVSLLLLLGIVSILLGIGLTYILVVRVTKPIKSLIIGAREISKGNLSYVITPTNSHDEIGQLSEVFNTMAQRLSLSYQSLEKQVKQRTEDLEKKVSELERINKLMINRELKMVELKKEIENLKKPVNFPTFSKVKEQ